MYVYIHIVGRVLRKSVVQFRRHKGRREKNIVLLYLVFLCSVRESHSDGTRLKRVQAIASDEPKRRRGYDSMRRSFNIVSHV